MIATLEARHREAAAEFANAVSALESSHASELEVARREVRDAH